MDVMAVTGPLPDRAAWAAAVGPALAPYTVDWEPWEVVDVSPEELFGPGESDEGEDAAEASAGEPGPPAGAEAAEREVPTGAPPRARGSRPAAGASSRGGGAAGSR
jgi:hypothetical protein